MYKVAVIGDRDSVYGFAALGLDVFYTNGRENCELVFKKVITTQQYAIVYITEESASYVMADIERLSSKPLPAVILIPGVKGNTGEGIISATRSVVKAVGSDILD